MVNTFSWTLLVMLVSLACTCLSLHAQETTRPVEYSISTIIGNNGDGKPALQVSIAKPVSLAADARNGNIYYVDSNNYQVRYFDPFGISHLIAGSPFYHYSATSSDSLGFANETLGNPVGVALNSKGDVFIVDSLQNRVKKVFYNETTKAFNMITIAGGGLVSTSGIPALSARIQPTCVSVSPLDEVYICDQLSHSIKKIVNDNIYTVVGIGIAGFSPDDTFANSTMLNSPNNIAFHPQTSEMYFIANQEIRYVSNGRVYTNISCFYCKGIVFNINGDMYFAGDDPLFNSVSKVVNGTATYIANRFLGFSGFSGDNGNAYSAMLNSPMGLAIYDNNLYIADSRNNRIRKINLTTNIITTVAGDGGTKYTGTYPNFAPAIGLFDPKSTFYNSQTDELLLIDSYRVLRLNSLNNYNTSLIEHIAGDVYNGIIDIDKLGNETFLSNPTSVFQSEKSGDVYIGTDYSIVKISKETQKVSTIAGKQQVSTGSGQPAINSVLYLPYAIALNESGEILFSERSVIRKIDVNGIISQVVNSGAHGIAFLNKNEFVFSQSNTNIIIKYDTTTGTMKTIAGSGLIPFNGDGKLGLVTNMNPKGICVNTSSGEIYFADNGRVRKLGLDGMITTVVGNGVLSTFTQDGLNGTATSVAPYAVAIHPITRELYFSDSALWSSSVIRRIDANDGKVYTVIGGGKTYSESSLANSTHLGEATYFTFSQNGDMYVSSSTYHVIKKMNYGSNIVYNVAGSGTSVTTGDGPALSTSLFLPRGLAVNSNDELYFVADSSSVLTDRISGIKKLSGGMISTLAGGIGDEGLANNANINVASSIIVTDNDIYFSDRDHYRIRKISLSNGIINSVVGAYYNEYNGDNLTNQTNINSVRDIRIRNGEIYFTDSQNNKIRKADLSGRVVTIAGNTTIQPIVSENGLATDAVLNNPGSIGFLPSGELVIADTENHVIRKIDLNGNISMIAGQYMQSGFNSDSNAKNALLRFPKGISITKDGKIVFIESWRVRMLTPFCPQGYNMTQTSSGLVCNLITTCFGIDQTNPNVCSGKGNCISLNNCLCPSGYSGLNCSQIVENSPKLTCFGIPFDDTRVCSGIGVCQSLNNCVCPYGYGGIKCEMFTCFGRASNDSLTCSGNGNCTSSDTCKCDNGWNGLDCSIPTCFSIPHNNATVCNGHGNCLAIDSCQCEKGWLGTDCSILSCFNIAAHDTARVCNGHGNCSNVDKCDCQFGWKGMNCSSLDIPKKDDSNVDYCALYPESYICLSFNTTETQVIKILNISLLDSKKIEFTSSSISISLPTTISQYLETTDNSLKNDSIQVVSSISKSSSFDATVVSPIVSLVFLKSSSNEKVKVQNLAQPISFSFERVIIRSESIETLNVSCVYFDEKIKEWRSDGMETEIKSLVRDLEDGITTFTVSIRCSTYHLTSFSVIDQNYKKAATKPTQPSKSNPLTKEDQSLQDNSVIIGVVVGAVGGVCVIVVALSILIASVCLLKKRKKVETNSEE